MAPKSLFGDRSRKKQYQKLSDMWGKTKGDNQWLTQQPCEPGNYACKPSAKEKRLRLILVGKTGVGKSSLGNVLLERKDIRKEEVQNSPDEGFVVCDGMESGTMTCCSKIGHNRLLDQCLEVIDTPGLFDTSSVDLLTTLSGFTFMLSLSVPGPHAVLFLVRCGVKFTKEEEEALYKIKRVFGNTVLNHMVIVFTHGDEIKIPKETLFDRAPSSLKKIIGLVGKNYTIMSKTEDRKTRMTELRDLFSKIKRVSSHGTEFYTNTLLRILTANMEKQLAQTMKAGHMSRDKALQKIKEDINRNADWSQQVLKKLLISNAMLSTFIGLMYFFALKPVSRTVALSFGTLVGLVTFTSLFPVNIISFIL